jgi:hypothetical protein
MIKIEITDPHLMDKKAIHETAKYLMTLAGAVMVTAPGPVPVAQPVTPLPVPFPAEKVYPQVQGRVNRTDETDKTPTPEPLFTEAEIKESDLLVSGANIEAEWSDAPVPLTPGFNPFKKNSVVVEENPDPEKEDTRGFKWDSRLHARTKNKNSDGTWRYQRGKPQEEIDRIEAEINQIKNRAPATFVPPAPPAPPAVPAAPVSKTVPPSTPVYLQAHSPEPQSLVAPVDDFPALMTLITTGISTQGLKRDTVQTILQKHGIPSLPVAASRPDLIPTIIQEIKEVLKNATR